MLGFPSNAGWLTLRKMRAIDLYMRFKQSRLSRLVHRAPNHDVCSHKLPRVIWIYWQDGFEAAPEMVRICAGTWAAQNPGWTVRMLDDANVAEFADLSDLEGCGLPIQKRANVLRLRLLKAHGGVWVDATTLCVKPLDHWLPVCMQTDAFMFSVPGNGRILSNWLMASLRGSALIAQIEDLYTRYLTKPPPYKAIGRAEPPYFNWHYCVEYLALTRRAFRRRVARIPKVSAKPSQMLMRRLRRGPDAVARLDDLVEVPVHKLNSKHEIDLELLRECLARLGTREAG